MSGIDQQVSPYRVVWETLAGRHWQTSVLYPIDMKEIYMNSGQQVVPRIREHEGEMKLCLRVQPDCPEQVLRYAILQALARIDGNSILAGLD